jgi:hypothetical protein
LTGCAARPTPTLTQTLAPVTTKAAFCPGAYPHPLSIQPTSADQVPLLSTLVVCTGQPTGDRPHGRGIFLRNGHDNAVWVVNQPGAPTDPRVMAPRTQQVNTFLSFVQNQRPVTGLVLPARASFEDPAVEPFDVHLTLNASAQAAWQVLNLAVTSVAEGLTTGAANRVQMAAHRVLGSSAPGRPAVLTCMAEGFDAGPAIVRADAGSRVATLEATLDLTNDNSACGAAINQAQATLPVAGLAGIDQLATARTTEAWPAAEALFALAGQVFTPSSPAGWPA